MSHRKRKQEMSPRPLPPGLVARLMGWGAHVIKEQIRWMTFFIGVAFICQVVFVTVPYPDTIYFAVVGGGFIGLAAPGRLWK